MSQDLRARLRRLVSEDTPPSLWDEDPMVAIERRLDEIRLMAKPRRDGRYVLDRIDTEQRDLITKYKNLPVSEIRKKKRKHWKLVDHFLWAIKIVKLLVKGFIHTKKYYVDLADVNQLRKKIEKMANTSSLHSEAHLRSSLGAELQLSISHQPQYRNKQCIKRITWMLRATKAFKHLFPAEMETDVAKYVAYEKYDDGRILAYQGRAPDRFLYVISGRVNLLRQYKLSTGQITKSMGFLSKGMTTDPEEMNLQWMREDTLVAKGQVEVLIMDNKAFSFLQHTTQGPPIEFLKSLDLFEEFPVQRFLKAPDAIEYNYFGQDKTIIRDSNRTPWLYVVKSGVVKVARYQAVIDAQASNGSKFGSHRIEDLGCGRNDSHAEAMLGVQARQKKFKAEKLKLPMINEGQDYSNPFAKSLGINAPIIYRHKSATKTTPQFTVVNVQEPSEHSDKASSRSAKSSVRGETPKKALLKRPSEEKLELPSLPSSKTQLTSSSESPLKSSESNHGESLWLTKEGTEHEIQCVFPKKKTEKLQHRDTYLQLDVLNSGDVFGMDTIMSKFIELEGLDHLQPPVASEPPGVSLISDGAEIIKISKRFFLQNAANNTMLKVETMYKEYISEEEAKQALYDQETWEQYKAALWEKMMAVMHPPQALR